MSNNNKELAVQLTVAWLACEHARNSNPEITAAHIEAKHACLTLRSFYKTLNELDKQEENK